MALIPVYRHGFIFWEATHCVRPPLPELSKTKSRLEAITTRATEYKRRQKREITEDSLTVLPSVAPEITDIQQKVIEAFNLTPDEFYGRSRVERVANARIASMALCRAYTERTVEEIAEAHNRHHRLVSYSSWRFAEIQMNDPFFAAAIASIETTLLQKAA
jgi:chromosomal replication initiation ATPase DnaA